MRRRKLFVVLAGLAVVAAGAAVLWPHEDRITRENCDRIKEGMSRAEVEAIFGPPGDYTTGPVTFDSHVVSPWNVDATRLNPSQENGAPYDWLTDAGWFTATFDDSGKVETRGFVSSTKIKQSMLDNLLWRAKHQWHCWFPE